MNNNKMKKRLLIIAFILIFIGLVFMAGKERNKSGESGESDNQFQKLIGQPAPPFLLLDREGEVWDNEKLKGKNAILFFNEGLICYPACWDEMLALANDSRFSENNTAVFSVVTDSKDSWQKAIDKMPELSAIQLMFDEGAKVSEEYGMLKAKSSMHTGSLPGHTYVIMDKTGIIRSVIDDPNMAKNGGRLYLEITKLQN